MKLFVARVVKSLSISLLALASVTVSDAWALEVAAPKLRTLMLAADKEYNLGLMRDRLDSTKVLGQIDLLDLRTGLPSLESLETYDSISVHSNFVLPDPVALGNLLADYVDTGGGVVVMPFATRTDPTLAIGGRWASGGYSPLPDGGSESTGTWTISTIDQPGHPVLQGVGEVRYSGRFTSAGPLAPSAERIVAWQRGNHPPEAPLVAELPGFSGRIMLFNAYPAAYNLHTDDLNAAGFLLLANTLHYAAAPEPSTVAILAGLAIPVLSFRRKQRCEAKKARPKKGRV